MQDYSMNDFIDDVPSEFTDEDRWFWIFTKPMLAVAGGCMFITLITAKVFSLFFGISWPVWILGIIFTVTVEIFMNIPYTGSNILKGGGDTLFWIMLRVLYRKRHSAIYTKGLKDTE